MKHLIPHQKLTKFEVFVMVVTAIEPIMNVPQIYRIYRTQSAGDFVVYAWFAGLMVNIVLLLYGIRESKRPLIFMALMWILIHSLMVIGILLYS